MGTRRDDLLDAGIELLGEHGIRALTHRRIDAVAGMPEGSTSNYFRTREALVEAIIERCSERQRARWEELATQEAPTTPAELARVIGAWAHQATGEDRAVTLSRYTILLEAAGQPELRAPLLFLGSRVRTWFVAWLRLVGSRDPEHHVHVVGNYVTGLVLHQLAVPDPLFDPRASIETLLTALLVAPAGEPWTPGFTALRRSPTTPLTVPATPPPPIATA